MIRIVVSSLTAALALTLPSEGATPSTAEMPPCEASGAALSAASAHLIDRDNARDLEGVLGGYTEDVVWLPPAGDVVIGKKSIGTRYETLFSNYKIDLRSETIEAASSNTIGFVRGRTTGMLTPFAGGPPIAVNDKFIAILRCEAGTWKVSHLAWSPREAHEEP